MCFICNLVYLCRDDFIHLSLSRSMLKPEPENLSMTHTPDFCTGWNAFSFLLENKFQGDNTPNLNLHWKNDKKSVRRLKKTLGTTEILTGTNQFGNAKKEYVLA